MDYKLLIGSGDWHWDGWITLDGDPKSDADIVALVPPLHVHIPPHMQRQGFSEILMSHFIEHLYPQDAKALLMECFNLLQDGGTLTMEQPNLDYCCKVVAGVIAPPPGKSREQFGYWGVFGRPEIDPLMGHKWGYTPEALTELVVSVGFKRENISVEPGKYHEPIRDFLLKVTK